MPKFDLSVPHSLGKEAASNRLHGFSDVLQQKYADQLSDLTQTWEGDQLTFSFTTFGIAVGGELHVEEDAVRVVGDLPFAAAMFKGKITGVIEEQLGKLLG